MEIQEKKKEPKKEKLFPIWCPTEDQKNVLKTKLEGLRKRDHKSNYRLIVEALDNVE